MNDSMEPCPRIEAVSALMDDALQGAARSAAERHVAACPLCGAALREFEALGASLRQLRVAPACEVDLAALVDARLPPAPRSKTRPRRPGWLLAPRGLGAAAALAAGAWLGLALTGGGAMATRPAAMAVFDAAPPGSLCLGAAGCAPRRR